MPIMGGYWFQPLTTASAALRRTSSGPGSSGNPWPRFTAPVSRASRDMTSNTEVSMLAKIGFMRAGVPGPRRVRNRCALPARVSRRPALLAPVRVEEAGDVADDLGGEVGLTQ